MRDAIMPVTRRRMLETLAGGAGLAALGLPGAGRAQGRKDVLVIGMDFSDAITYDPATEAQNTPPIVFSAVYDTLVTMSPGDYTNPKPALASSWARTPDGRGWRFTIRDGAKFSTGNPVTIDDVKWSFDRVINIQAQNSQYLQGIESVTAVPPNFIDITLKNPARPILDILCFPVFAIYERKVLEAHGGVATADAKEKDKASAWLNQNSCGSGAYTMTSWQRNSSLQLQRNPHYWRGLPAFERIVFQQISDPAVQLLELQRGNIDVAFNLTLEQIATVKTTLADKVRVQPLQSVDFIFIGLTSNAEFSKAMAVKECRQAIGYAIDYDGIRDHLLGGLGLHPATFLPIGVTGSTPEIAKEIGFHQDLDRAKALLAKAGYPNGFSFKLAYGNALITGVQFSVIAQKVQADLARVGIQADLDPMDPVTMRTQNVNGKLTATLNPVWNPTGIDNWLWASATVQRVAKRVHWDVPADMAKLVDDATDEQDPQKQVQMWIEYQKRMVDQANAITLFQPVYQIAVNNRIKTFPLTAAGWEVDMFSVTM